METKPNLTELDQKMLKDACELGLMNKDPDVSYTLGYLIALVMRLYDK